MTDWGQGASRPCTGTLLGALGDAWMVRLGKLVRIARIASPTTRLELRASAAGPSRPMPSVSSTPLPWAKLRQGHKLIRLGERYSPERLDAACRRALSVDVRRLERILVEALEQEATHEVFGGRAPSSLVTAPLERTHPAAHAPQAAVLNTLTVARRDQILRSDHTDRWINRRDRRLGIGSERTAASKTSTGPIHHTRPTHYRLLPRGPQRARPARAGRRVKASSLRPSDMLLA